MTDPRAAFTLAGATVVLAARRADGCALVAYADRGGKPTNRFTLAFPHELRRAGMHLAGIKAAIGGLPLATFGFETVEVHTTQAPAPRPRCLLSAHYAAAASERED